MSYFVAVSVALYFCVFVGTLRTVPHAPRKPEPSNGVLCFIATFYGALMLWGIVLLLGAP